MLGNAVTRTCLVLLASLSWLGCSESTKVGDNDGRYGPPGSTPNTPGADAGPRPPVARDGGAEDTRELFQTKSTAQLAASIAQCVGAGKTTVAEDMLTVNPDNPVQCFPGTEANRCSFLTRGLFSAGADVVTAQTSVFDGAESSTKQGTRPDQLGVEVLTALQSVAGVVASNCLRTPDDAMCSCAGRDAARAMVARCLPSFDPATAAYEAAAGALEAKCAAEPGAAIASMLASYAFLRVN